MGIKNNSEKNILNVEIKAYFVLSAFYTHSYKITYKAMAVNRLKCERRGGE
jgi:hypothetical protein